MRKSSSTDDRREMPLDAVATVTISPGESFEMGRLIRNNLHRHWPTAGPIQGVQTYFDAAELFDATLPARARHALSRLRDGIVDAVVIHGLPTDDARAIAEAGPKKIFPWMGYTWTGITSRHLGHEFGYSAEKTGALVHDVVPQQGRERGQSNASSATELSLHTEIAFHAVRPDFIVLYGVRSPEPAPATTLVRLEDVARALPEDCLNVLMQPRFELRPPESFLAEGTKDAPVRISPIGRVAGSLTVRWHGSLRGIDEEAQRAAAAFRARAAEMTMSAQLLPGSLLAFSNERCLHGRRPFTAKYDQNDRWLLRTYVRRDIAHIVRRIDVFDTHRVPIVSDEW